MAAKKEFSPEAKGYRATLKALGKIESSVHRAGAEKMRAERMEGEAPESAEKRAGKERLAEIIEREESLAEPLERLAILLGNEPWQALQQLEKNNELDRQIDVHKAIRLKCESFRDIGATVVLQKRIDELLAHNEVIDHLFTYGNDFLGETQDLEEKRILKITEGISSGYHHIKVEHDNHETVPAVFYKSQIEREPYYFRERQGFIQPAFLRRDFWTIGREIAIALPEMFGYKDAKEADRMITAQVEKIGRAFGQDFKKIDGAYYVGPKTEKQEKLRVLDKKMAAEIVTEYKTAVAERIARENQILAEAKAKELVVVKKEKAAEKKFKLLVREHLLRLHEINKEISPAQLPATVEKSLLPRWLSNTMEGLALVMSSRVREQKKSEVDRLAKMKQERVDIIRDLTLLNDKLREKNTKYAFNDEPGFGGRYAVRSMGHKLEIGRETRDYWDSKADEVVEKIVDEDLLQDQLDELKSK